MKTFTKLASAALLATAAMSASANQPFTIDVSGDPTPGTQAFTTFEATEVNATYQEGITVNAAGTMFAASIFVDFNSFSQQAGTFPASATGLGVNYGMYAVINVTGNIIFTGFDALGAPNDFDLVNFAGDMSVWADWDNNTAQNALLIRDPGFQLVGGVVSPVLTNTGDDVELATTSNLFGSTTGGAFDPSASFSVASNSFTLTTAGESVFVAPRPFYMELSSTGDISSLFNDVDFSGLTAGLQEFGDTASIRFVPEPTSVAFLGLGLIGLAAAARRKA